MYTSMTPITWPVVFEKIGTYTSASTEKLPRSYAFSRAASVFISTLTSPASAALSSSLSGNRWPIRRGSFDQRTVAWRSHTLTRTTSGSPWSRRANSRWLASRATTPRGAVSSASTPVRSTSRRASAAVFSHSQSSTERVSREEIAKPMEAARAITQRKLRIANFAPDANLMPSLNLPAGRSRTPRRPRDSCGRGASLDAARRWNRRPRGRARYPHRAPWWS